MPSSTLPSRLNVSNFYALLALAVSRCASPPPDQQTCQHGKAAQLGDELASLAGGGFSLFCNEDVSGCGALPAGTMQDLDYFYTATPEECAQACNYYNAYIGPEAQGGPIYCNAATWRSTPFNPNINCFVKVLNNTCHDSEGNTAPPNSTRSAGAFFLVRKQQGNTCASPAKAQCTVRL